MSEDRRSPHEAGFLKGAGEMARLIRAFDWAATPLGTPSDWPAPLKTLVNLMLSSTQPMFMAWGPARIWLYNDAFTPILGRKHPQALGAPAHDVWAEGWADLAPLFARVFAGEPVTMEGFSLDLDRHGTIEEAHFDFSYTPALGENGDVAGLFGACIETTQTVIAGRRLAAANERQQQLFGQMPGFIAAMSGPQHIYEYVNDAYEKISGRTGFIGRSVREMFPELEGQGFFELLDQVYRTGEPIVVHAMELRLQGSDQVRYIDFIYQPIRDTVGSVSGVFVGGHEVSERMRTAMRRDALIRLSDKIRDLEQVESIAFAAAEVLGETLQVSRVGYGTIDPEQETLNVEHDWTAPGVESLAGSLKLRDYGSFIDSLKANEFISIVDVRKDARTEAAASALESRHARSFVNVPVVERGRLVAVLYVNHASVRNWSTEDLALIRETAERTRTAVERARAHAALREANATLERKIIERTQARGLTWQLSPDLMGALNSKGYFETSNPAWQTVLGWSEAEVARMSIFDFLHPDDAERTRARFENTKAGRETARFPNRYRCKDGSYRWISWVAVPEEGLIYTTGRDVTEAKAAEEELLRTQEALRQSQKMEAVGQLTGGIAHDFNNMLAIILGSLDLATRRLERGDTGVLNYLNNAREGATRAASLTQRLLSFSRQSPLAPRVTDVNALVGAMSELLRRTLGERIALEAVQAGGLWATHVDPNQLESAIINLAVNARDAMPEGGKLTIEIANAHLDEHYAAREIGVAAGQYVMIAVTDVGSGMPAEVVERAFDPFYTTKDVGKGTGLGLSMVYGFAKQSGGHVRLYSELGRGTSAKIYLPRHFGSVEEATAARVSPPITRAAPAETVLVVEDEENVRRMSTAALSDLGYTVHAASSGEEAMRLFDSLARVDLLFTDIVMPGMTGRQLADALRKKVPALKVLYTTGYTRNAVVHNGVLDAGVAFLPKPFSIADLAAKLRAVLDA